MWVTIHILSAVLNDNSSFLINYLILAFVVLFEGEGTEPLIVISLILNTINFAIWRQRSKNYNQLRNPLLASAKAGTGVYVGSYFNTWYLGPSSIISTLAVTASICLCVQVQFPSTKWLLAFATIMKIFALCNELSLFMIINNAHREAELLSVVSGLSITDLPGKGVWWWHPNGNIIRSAPIDRAASASVRDTASAGDAPDEPLLGADTDASTLY